MHRIIVNTIKNIRRSPYQALAAVMVLTVTFLIAQMFTVLSWSTHVITGYFETRPQVTAFFKDDVSEADLLNLKAQLEKLDYVKSVNYISKQDALKIYQEQNKDDPLLLEMVTADILPASLEVSAKTIDALPEVKTQLQSSKGIEEVVYQQDVIDALRKWSNGIRVSGLILVGFLVLTSLLVVTIVISMKVATKRQEIATMRLLGAKSGFIVGPFILEGSFYGLAASVIAWGVLYLLILYSTPIVVSFLGDIPLLPMPLWFMGSLLAGSVGLSVVMGVVAGSVSSRRFGN